MVSRKVSGILGLLGSLVLVVLIISFMIWSEFPDVLVLGAGVFFGLLFLLRVIGVYRGTRARKQNYSTFESNSLGQPVTEKYVTPYQADAPVTKEEKILCHAAPIRPVASGVKSFSSGPGTTTVMGKARAKDSENCLVLTNRRFLFLMLGPKELRQYSQDSKITNLLESLPGDASAKRNWLWLNAANEIKEALGQMIDQNDLETMRTSLFSYSIPLKHIRGIKRNSRSQSLILAAGQHSLQYSFRLVEDFLCVTETLDKMGFMIKV